ncbi:hypothetical protein ACET3Z_018207 [Daucus carota]
MPTYPEAFKTAMKDLEKASKRAYEKMQEFDPKMPTPGSGAHFRTGGTPSADHPSTSKNKEKGPVKAFIAPRKS